MNTQPDSPADRVREQLALHRAILRTAMDGYWMLDLDGNILEVNDAYCRMSGYDAEELVRMHVSALDAEDAATGMMEHLRRIIENGAERFETRQRRKDGTPYDVEMSVQVQADGDDCMVAFVRDITARRRAEAELRESQEMFAQFMLHSPIYAYIKKVDDAESRVLQASENYVDMLGIPGSQMRDKSMHELFPADFAEKMTEDDRTVVNNARVLYLPEEFNGRYYTTIKFPIDLHGKKLLAGYTIDITEQKQAEFKLQEKEKMLLESQAVANLGSYVWDIRTGFWDSSVVLDQIFGIDDSYVRSLEGWVEIIHPDWREVMNDYVLNRVVGRRERFDREYRIIHQRSGKERWVHGLGQLEFDDEGQPTRLIGTITDITDRKLAEERLQLLMKGIEQSPAMIMITDPEGTIEFVNAKFTEMTGFTQQEAIGNNPRILKSGDIAPDEYRQMWLDIKKGREWKGEFRNRKKNGELYWASALISPIINDRGQITHYIALQEDITPRKTAEIELLRAKEHAERMGKLKDAFIANISHEIRTPLNAILGFSTIIEESCSSALAEGERVYFDHIRFAADRLMRTVDLILVLSRIQAGDLHLHPQDIDLPSQLNRLRESFRFAASQKDLELVLLNEVGDLHITTDEYCLTEAVSNLLNNAIKFTRQGNVTMRVSKSPEARYVLEVRDTGVGISDEYKPYLFEPYSQEEIGYSRRFEGIGLGMTLVKKYLDLLQLPISFESRKGVGTKFSIDLTSIVTRPERAET